jgi:hypothetical protein
MPDHEKRAEQARRRAEGLAAIRLRYCINTHLDEQGIATPAGLARATGLPAAEAAGLLRRRQPAPRWRPGRGPPPPEVSWASNRV